MQTRKLCDSLIENDVYEDALELQRRYDAFSQFYYMLFSYYKQLQILDVGGSR